MSYITYQCVEKDIKPVAYIHLLQYGKNFVLNENLSHRISNMVAKVDIFKIPQLLLNVRLYHDRPCIQEQFGMAACLTYIPLLVIVTYFLQFTAHNRTFYLFPLIYKHESCRHI